MPFATCFNSKLFTAFFVICFLPLLVEAILIYLHHNVNALAIMKVNVRELIPIDAFFFQSFVNVQGGFAFFVALLVGPPLVSRDLRNNALPLYLCRPFSRTEYVMGKMSVLLILLVGDHLGAAVVVVSVSVVSRRLRVVRRQSVDCQRDLHWQCRLDFVAGVAFAGVSALVKWRVIASGALLGIFFIPVGVRRSCQPNVPDALGQHHQSGRVDEERYGRSVRHVRARYRTDHSI